MRSDCVDETSTTLNFVCLLGCVGFFSFLEEQQVHVRFECC